MLVTNGTTKGCPLLMLPYTFYNTDLINIAKGKSELSTGFVDDCTFIAVADTLDEAHHLKRYDGKTRWGAGMVMQPQLPF